MATADQLVRERIRRNVGYPNRPLPFHLPSSKAAPWIMEPAAAFPPPGEDGGAFPGLKPVDGRSYCLTMAVAAGTREVLATPRLGFPFQLRKVNLSGDIASTDAASFRILLAEDNDTAAVADPSGSDIYDLAGDLVGAEDPGMHAHLTAGPLIIEPWTLVRETGRFLKLKVHNATAGTRLLVAFFDLDILDPLGP